MSVLSDSAALNLGRRPSIAEVSAEPRRPSGDRRSSGSDSRSVRADGEACRNKNFLFKETMETTTSR